MLRVKNFPFYPFVFFIYPVLFIFSRNKSQLEWSALISNGGFLLILGTLLLLGLFLVVRNFTYSALVVSLLFILVFSFGPVWQSVMNWQIANISVGRPSVILILLSIIFLWVLLRAWRSRKSLGGITLYLNVVAFSLLLMNLRPLVDSLMQAKNEEARKIYSEFQNYELGKRGGYS